MPRHRPDKQDKDQIDWTKALILERKLMLGLDWAAIENKVGMTSEYLRRLVSSKPTWRWPPYTLKKVCQALGIEYGTYTIKIPGDENGN